MDTSTPKRQTDVRRRTVAPTTLQNLLAASSGAQSAVNDLKSDEALDKLEEELNRRVDEETQVLVQGMADLVGMSVVSPFFRVWGWHGDAGGWRGGPLGREVYGVRGNDLRHSPGRQHRRGRQFFSNVFTAPL
jgi:hypothetical protein